MNRLPFCNVTLLLFAGIFSNSAVAQEPQNSGCPEIPREDALPALCAPPTSEIEASAFPPVQIALTIPEGTPLRISLDQRTRLAHVGETVHGKVVEPVYAFDQQVIPAGSTVTGHVTRIDRVPAKKRILSYSGGNFTPFHKYQVTFDELKLPDGKTLDIKTETSPGTAVVVHLLTNKAKETEEKKKNVAARAASNVRQDAQTEVHSTVEQIKLPNLMHRLKTLVYSQSPVHRQYIEKGTRFNATLEGAINFGETYRSGNELANLGGAPEPDSLLHARLSAGVSSADATRGVTVNALLTEPVFSGDHKLLLPANARLVGEVQEAKPAQNFHRNGELRIAFNRIELPSGAAQAMQGTLEGMEVDRSAHLALDQEGGTRATTPKTRYLSTGFSLAMLAAASRPDTEHGRTDPAGDADTRAGAGIPVRASPAR